MPDQWDGSSRRRQFNPPGPTIYINQFTSRGLGLLAHYTISKLITDSDSPGTDIDWLGGYTGLQNWKNLHLERSLATFDVPKRFVLSVNYQLPFGRGRAFGQNFNKVADAFIGGWEISSILTFSAGYPIVPQSDSADLLSGDQRPNIVGDYRTTGSPSQRIQQYFNADAFEQPEPDVYGNAPRTLPNYRTFGVHNGDFTLMKHFKFTENKYAQFRIEAFNVTNTPTFGRPRRGVRQRHFRSDHRLRTREWPAPTPAGRQVLLLTVVRFCASGASVPDAQA